MVALTAKPGAQPPDVAAAPWLAEALTLLESRDEIGPLDGRGVLRMLDALDRRLPLLGLPWCGIFVAHCLRTALPEVELPRFYPRARPWLAWGRAAEPKAGAILVFWRLHPRSPLGHVGFCLSQDSEGVEVLGGNQHDRIAIERRQRDRLLGARWPNEISPMPGQARSE